MGNSSMFSLSAGPAVHRRLMTYQAETNYDHDYDLTLPYTST